MKCERGRDGCLIGVGSEGGQYCLHSVELELTEKLRTEAEVAPGHRQLLQH